jgi:hypothetical protein
LCLAKGHIQRDLGALTSPLRRENIMDINLNMFTLGADGVYYTRSGDTFADVLAIMVRLARAEGRLVRFHYKDTTVAVAADSNPALLERDWRRADNGYLGEVGVVVGPYPVSRLSPAEEARDATISDAKAALRRLQHEAAESYQA